MAKESFNLVAYCRTCNEPRYVSTRKVTEEEALSPTLFRAVNHDGPPPSEGPATCYICQSSLTFVKQDVTKLEGEPLNPEATPGAGSSPEALAHMAMLEQEMRTTQATTPAPRVRASVSPVVQEVFKVADGETVQGIKERGDRIMVITNKRIVLV